MEIQEISDHKTAFFILKYCYFSRLQAKHLKNLSFRA